jgi:hypothetical protein
MIGLTKYKNKVGKLHSLPECAQFPCALFQLCIAAICCLPLPAQLFLVLGPIGTHDQIFICSKTFMCFEMGPSLWLEEGVWLLFIIVSTLNSRSNACTVHKPLKFVTVITLVYAIPMLTISNTILIVVMLPIIACLVLVSMVTKFW